jgi:hypothetical protein
MMRRIADITDCSRYRSLDCFSIINTWSLAPAGGPANPKGAQVSERDKQDEHPHRQADSRVSDSKIHRMVHRRVVEENADDGAEGRREERRKSECKAHQQAHKPAEIAEGHTK